MVAATPKRNSNRQAMYTTIPAREMAMARRALFWSSLPMAGPTSVEAST